MNRIPTIDPQPAPAIPLTRKDGRKSFRYDGDNIICKTCKQSLPLDQYYQHSNKGKSHYSSYCHECRKIGMIIRYRGITKAQYEHLLKRASGFCDICGRPYGLRPSLDHDHATGKVRGLLCTPCNTALGLFQDNPAWLLRAAEYLESAGEETPKST